MGLNRELEGLFVVSLEQAVAAPYCGLLLADAGARVVKVERLEGDFARRYDQGADGESVLFSWLNRGKESICIDLNEDSDEKLLRNMLKNADVFLHNLAPGSLARRGFAGKVLRKENRNLITCEINGYGNKDQAKKKKAYDFLVQAESGICSVNGTEEHPARVGVSICDIASGQAAFSGILRALLQRANTGAGIDLSISMFDVMADFMNFPLLSYRYLGGSPKRMGLSHSLIMPYGAYTLKDETQILVAVQSNREWLNFCDGILDRPELALDDRFSDNTSRVKNRESLDIIISTVFSNYSSKKILKKLDKYMIAYARLNSVSDLSNHDLLRNTSAYYEGCRIEMADLPITTDNIRHSVVPALNQHGSKLRHEFNPNNSLK